MTVRESFPWRCSLCDHDQAELLFAKQENVGQAGPTFTLWRCQQCGLVTLRPQPPDLVALYPANYEPYWLPNAEVNQCWQRWQQRRHFATRANLVAQACSQGGYVLDIGCGTGGFLHALCESSCFQGIGVDISHYALQVAQRQQIQGVCANARDCCLAPASFDIVTLWEVIEHIPEPLAALADIRRLLRPGGIMLLSTPNSQSWQAHLWRQYWQGWESPRHLQIFSWATVERLLDATGFQLTRRLTLPVERYYAVESVATWLRAQLGTLDAGLTTLLAGAGLAAWPLLRVIDHTPMASTIVLEARVRP
ncbi:MAG: class I SAM-dependent methyltransferase [Caldilineaceae bacterium]